MGKSVKSGELVLGTTLFRSKAHLERTLRLMQKLSIEIKDRAQALWDTLASENRNPSDDERAQFDAYIAACGLCQQWIRLGYDRVGRGRAGCPSVRVAPPEIFDPSKTY